MSIWQDTLERRQLLDRARAALCALGFPYVHSAKTVRKLIEDQMGKQPDMTEKDLVTLFVTSMAVQVPSAIKMRSVRPYVPDMAMRQAAIRAQVQPSMIGVNSKKEISR